VPAGLAWAWFCYCARQAQFFIAKKEKIARHIVFTLNILFYTPQGRQEWVDGGGWVWMTRAINSIPHQSSCLGFALAVGPGFL